MIKPLKHRVLIQRDKPKEITEAGLIIPEEAQKRETRGVVLELGSTADSDIKIGNRVVFGYHDGTKIEAEYCDGKENCWIVADNQIRAVLND